MIVYEILTIILAISYISIFLFYLLGWMSLPVYIPSESKPHTKVSIIIPARNEEQNIFSLLNDLLQQTYPPSLFEIIVVDDFSEDRTFEIVESIVDPRIKFLRLKDFIKEDERIFSYKKKAIEIAISNSNGELMITTDADCRVKSNWLATMVNFYEEKRCQMIVATVLMEGERKFFDKFQELDFVGMMGITAATLHLNFPTMCNGANLAFQRKAFEEVNGYEGVSEKSSGDDMLLMHKIAEKWNGGAKFLKSREAVVYSSTQKSIRSFFSQRMRWTSKSQSYSDWKIKANLLLVYLFNLLILASLFLSIFYSQLWLVFFFQLSIKIILDFAFLSQVTGFFNRQKLLWLFLLIEALHIFYIVVVGFAGNFFQTSWKGRKVQ